ncbi:MAG: Rieske (2Fe-2S) protein [Actinobacteria bacterium]|nr:Rieske (2Fe-2S) protein [Actinomycetota bacterium]
MSRFPWPIPFGWFAVAWTHELERGHVQPYRAFARDLVLWRDADGAAHVQDAFCPHLGAHLGHGGRVEGCALVCPFHGWEFDAEGRNTCIPYSERTNGKARLRTYPVLERNGLVMAWYHPADEAPSWDIPSVPEFAADHPEWAAPVTRFFTIDTAWQEMAENGVDAAHFRYVHGTAEVPILERYEPDGHRSHMRSKQFFVTPRGNVEGRIDTDAEGAGFSVVRFSGIIDTMLLGCATPIERDRCEMRFTFTVRRFADERATTSVGEAAINEISRQLLEDKPIWEHKVFIERPALADTDGPFLQFRQWASQFYVNDAR